MPGFFVACCQSPVHLCSFPKYAAVGFNRIPLFCDSQRLLMTAVNRHAAILGMDEHLKFV